MPRRKKNEDQKERMTFTLSPDAAKGLGLLSEKTNIPMSRIVEMGIWDYMGIYHRSFFERLSKDPSSGISEQMRQAMLDYLETPPDEMIGAAVNRKRSEPPDTEQ